MSQDGVKPAEQAPDRLPWRHLVGIVLFACVAFALYLSRTDFHVQPRQDGTECVVVAEELGEGNGFTTRVISPSVLTYLHEHDRARPPWPNLLRSPLPCLMIAWLSRVFAQPTAVALSSGIFFLLSVPLSFLIAHRLAGPTAGWFASVTYVASRSGLWYGASGLNESSTIFALAGIVYCLMLPASWATCLAAGVLAGIGYLGRSTFTLWALPIIAYLIWQSRAAGLGRIMGRLAAFGVPVALAFVWWGTTVGAMTGEFGASGQADIMIRVDTDLYPGRSPALTQEHWDPMDFMRAHPGAIVRKYGRIAEQTWPRLLDMGAMPLLVAFFAAALFLVIARGRRVGVHRLVYALIAFQALLVPLASEGHGGVGTNRYLDPFGPIAAALGAAFAIELLRRYQVPVRRAMAAMALVVALTGIPVLFNMVVGPFHGASLAQARARGDFLARQAEPGDILATTNASLDGWVSGLHAIYLPVTPEEFGRMREMLEVDWVHLGEMPAALADRIDAWEPIIADDEQLEGFDMAHRFPDGSVLLGRTRAAGHIER